jgi:hypothetical protein
VNLSELRTALKERRDDYSPSDAKLNRKLNQAYLDVCSRRRWGWLRREYTASTTASQAVTLLTLVTGSRSVVVDASAPISNVVFGKRILLGGSFYEVVNVSADSLTLTLDRAYTGTASSGPDGTGTVLYEDVALPVGAQTVSEAVLFTGSNSYPNSLESISPVSMVHRDKDVRGQPSKYSTIEKEPIPPPRSAPDVVAAPSTVSGSMGAGTYTYWYTHVDKQSGAESALSPPSTVTLDPAGTQTAVEVGDTGAAPSTSVDARVDFNLRLYRSTAGGSVPRLLSDPIDNTIRDFNDLINDDYLGEQGPESASSLFLTLYPAPDSVYQVHLIYQVEAKPLSDDNDRPLFDSQFHPIILDGAASLMLDAADEQGRAGAAMKRFEAGIYRMMAQDKLSLQNVTLIGRGSRKLRGKKTWWYGALGS